MKTEIEFVPYGKISLELTKDQWRRTHRHVRVSGFRRGDKRTLRRIFISFSHDLDDPFVEMFCNKATPEARLLIFNEGLSSDQLISRIFDLQIRKPERCYVIDAKPSSGRTVFFQPFLERFVATFESNEGQDRIFDARIERGTLRVVSPNFVRLEIPVSKIPQFKNAKPAQIESFEIDEDGSFIYWPDLDVHLGWNQFQQLINPEAALKASQKNEEFNRRYGKAVQRFREAAGLKRRDISGLSEKQLGRIEKGARLTTNAIEALAKAHKIDRNEFMRRLAQIL